MTVRRLSTFRIGRGWHKLITLACLFSFIFVATTHAGHHLAVADHTAIVTAASALTDSADDGDGTAKDNVCLFCALAAAAFPTLPLISGDTLRVLVETHETALAPPVPAAEYPPPIT